MQIAVLAALPEEFRPFLGITAPWRKASLRGFRAWQRTGPWATWLLIETGMSTGRLHAACDRVLELGFRDLMVSAGFAGGLSDELKVGTVLCGRVFHRWDPRLGRVEPLCYRHSASGLIRRYRSGFPLRDATVISSPSMTDKPALAASLKNLGPPPSRIVDMETADLAAHAHRHSVPFLSLRAISDELHQEIDFDPLSLCDPATGRVRVHKALSAMIRQPRLGSSFYQSWRRTSRAGRALGEALRSLFALPCPEPHELAELVLRQG